MTRHVYRMLLSILTLFAILGNFGVAAGAEGSGTTYYVDCSAGNDANAGTSPTTAWKSLTRANKATLVPGDQLLLKRDCSWTGPLRASWQGTASAPILISAYGSGALPKIQNAPAANVHISGRFLILEYLQTTFSPSSYDSLDSTCQNQPIGWRVGFNFVDGAQDNLLRFSQATHAAAGVHLTEGSARNKVLNNTITDNDGVWNMQPGNVMGGTGVVLKGTDNEIAWNTFRNNQSVCAKAADGSIDPELASITIELYNAVRANVHHNTVTGDRVFVELGSGNGLQAQDNTFAYNLHTTSAGKGELVITRGAGVAYGPVWGTRLYNNTGYYTGAESQAVVCQACSPSVLSMHNNILVAVAKGLYVNEGNSLDESANIFWPVNGLPAPTHFIQNWTLQASSMLINPQFVNPGAGDLHLQAASGAIDNGETVSVSAGYATDIDQEVVYRGTTVDIGADETDVLASNAPPVVAAPSQTLPLLRLNTADVNVVLSWGATDPDGIAMYVIEQSTNGGAFLPLQTITTTATSQQLGLKLPAGATYQFRVNATDSRGATSTWVMGPSFRVTAYQESSSAIVDSGTWATVANANAYGGALQNTSTPGNKVTFTFTGTNVSWVTTRGPSFGQAEVWLDGVKIKAVELYAATTTTKATMYAADGLANSTHTLEIRVRNTKHAQSTGKRVDVDAFVVLQ